MKNFTWSIAFVAASATPIAGGAIGCASRTEQITAANASWILIWSLPFGIFGLILTSLIMGHFTRQKREPKDAVLPLIVANSLRFFGAIWFLDGISGV
jgi:hypothetical protein